MGYLEASLQSAGTLALLQSAPADCPKMRVGCREFASANRPIVFSRTIGVYDGIRTWAGKRTLFRVEQVANLLKTTIF
jgi:hypothetical protein